MAAPRTPAAPGVAATANRIPQTSECRPTPADLAAGVLPDELMIDWLGTPPGSTVSVCLPAVGSDAILHLGGQLYGGGKISKVDD